MKTQQLILLFSFFLIGSQLINSQSKTGDLPIKRINSILVIILFGAVVSESRGQKQTDNNDFITLNVIKNYSHKKELILQDFMDVEYIALETNDDFINQSIVLDIGKEFMLVKNRINDGNIFVYNRLGKAIRKINCKGQLKGKLKEIAATLNEESNPVIMLIKHRK